MVAPYKLLNKVLGKFLDRRVIDTNVSDGGFVQARATNLTWIEAVFRRANQLRDRFNKWRDPEANRLPRLAWDDAEWAATGDSMSRNQLRLQYKSVPFITHPLSSAEAPWATVVEPRYGDFRVYVPVRGRTVEFHVFRGTDTQWVGNPKEGQEFVETFIDLFRLEGDDFEITYTEFKMRHFADNSVPMLNPVVAADMLKKAAEAQRRENSR